ncbi:MAG: hypothetical protein QOH72_4756 [Solirubrobacteraceae bacterium]|jgi:hypothetical protein|nr:hypothetical protein [Solirubrobacteraceae bacterium]
MPRRIAAIARALAANLNPAERGVHYHGVPQGSAFACTDARCTAPRGGARA